MSSAPNEWTLEGFVEHFDFFHHNMLDHKFVWVLGAGASLASGIPLGSKLVDQWLDELHVREDGRKTPLEDWATADNLGIKGFKYEDRATYYPKIYERRFQKYPDEGYAYLESVMADVDPSPGYSILAAALAGDPPERPPRHNAVVTTNFDNLVADALSIYTDTFPFVCGHESLTPFVRVAMRRPVVCKIHRDLLLAPQNDPHSLRRLHNAWGMALRALFEHYTPLFIGYGGNDDTLMDLLESLEPNDIRGQMIWCYYENEKPTERIVNLVTDHKGILVPVPDFDLLMVLLGEKMGISLLDEEIGRRAHARSKRYRDRIQGLDTVGHPEVTKALVATYERSGGWWAWEQKAKSERDPERREVVYRQGIQHCPHSAPLHGNFALFMNTMRGDHDEGERLHRKAIELDPKNATQIGNFASFMTNVRGDHDEAERLYRKALELDPKHANNTGNYAAFLLAQGRLDESGAMLDKAKPLVHHAKEFTDQEENRVAAKVALHSAILAGVTKKDDTRALEELRNLLSDGFPRSGSYFKNILGYAQKHVAPEDYALYSALADAILDAEKVPTALALLDQRIATAKAAIDREPKIPVIEGQQSYTDGHKEAIENKQT